MTKCGVADDGNMTSAVQGSFKWKLCNQIQGNAKKNGLKIKHGRVENVKNVKSMMTKKARL